MDGAIAGTATYRILSDILSRLVALEMSKPFKSLNTLNLLTDTSLK